MNLRLTPAVLALWLALAGAAWAAPPPASPDQSAARDAGLKVAGKMFAPETVEAMKGAATSAAFGHELGDMAIRNVMGELWARPGLDPRSRSLATLGMLIALRQTEEFKIHVAAALRNGCTVAEIEEVILHASAYAGFPAANQARLAAAEALKAQGAIR